METKASSKPATTLQKLSYYVVLSALIFVFASSIYMKFSNDEYIVNNFSKWNLLDWKNIIAGIELAGVLLLLFKRTVFVGSSLLSIMMLGAIYIHFQHSEPFYFPLAILLVIWINHIFIRPKN